MFTGIYFMKGLKTVRNYAKTLYNSILNGKTDPDSLCTADKKLLFGHLCELIEQGESVNGELIEKCAASVEAPDLCPPRELVERIYKKAELYKETPRIYSSTLLRRLIVAAMAVLVFVVFSFGTASAFGIDVVEQVKNIFEKEDPASYIRFEKANGGVKRYTDLNALFEKELPDDYLLPTVFPEGVEPTRVTKGASDSGTLFTILLASDSGEPWYITAKSESESYLPLGYKYTANNSGIALDFVYTVSRNNGSITHYNVYTVRNGVLYTFSLHTGEWDEVKLILDSLRPSARSD